jgi:hypothetical protein
MEKPEKEVFQYNERTGSVAFINLYLINPESPREYAMLSITEYGETQEEARIGLSKAIEEYGKMGWTLYRPSVDSTTGKPESSEPILSIVSEDEIKRVPIDDSGNALKVFKVVGIEKYMTKTNKTWLKVHVAESDECKYGLTGRPDWKLPKDFHKWFNETAKIGTVYKDIPASLAYVAAEKNDKGYWAFIKEFRSTPE